MTILSKHYTEVAEGLWLWVSNYHFYTTFGIHGRYDTSYRSGRFIETGTPGTGFYARESDSHNYRDFVQEMKGRNVRRYRNLLLGKEFSYDGEIGRAGYVRQREPDSRKREILESYINTLSLAKEAEQMERMVRAVKDKTGHHPNKFMVSVMNHYKNRIVNLGHDVRATQMDVKSMYGEEQLDQYSVVVKAFSNMMQSHRIWQVNANAGIKERYFQVFFDLGIFDYIQSPTATPLLRDRDGVLYFIYPEFIIKARRATDFDLIPLSQLSFNYREVPYFTLDYPPEYHTQRKRSFWKNLLKRHRSHRHRTPHYRNDYAVTNANDLQGKFTRLDMEMEGRERVLGEMRIPELNLTYYSIDNQSLHAFVKAMNRYKQ